MNAIAEKIRDFILQDYLPGEARENLGDDTPLVTSGILDSFALLNLVAFIEREFGVDIRVYETPVERFDRIANIAAEVVRRRTGHSPAAATAR